MSDSELLEAWRHGDEAAGRTLVLHHFDGLHRFFATKAPDVAEDLVQETFMACVKARDTFEGRSSVRTYLFGIARRRLLMYWRSKRRRGGDAVDFDQVSLQDLGASPSSLAHARGERRRLLQALRCIPLESQIVLELRYWEGMTAPAIAAVLGVAEVTARRRLKRAHEVLGTQLDQSESADTMMRASVEDIDRWVAAMRASASKPPED